MRQFKMPLDRPTKGCYRGLMQLHSTKLIQFLAKKHRRSQAHYRAALTEILDGITERLVRGHSLTLIGFGTFYTRVKAAGKVKDIRTGKLISYGARRQPAFHAGDLLKAATKRSAISSAKPSKAISSRKPGK